MSKTYHINPKTGRPGECTAYVRDCKYSQNGETIEHYNSLDEALDAYESMNSDKTFSSLKKPEPLDVFSAQNDIFRDGYSEQSEKDGNFYLVERKEAKPEAALTSGNDMSKEKNVAPEKKSSDQQNKTNRRTNKNNTEFNIIHNSFPSTEIINKYMSIIEKYGEDTLRQTKSLVDNPELFNNPSELFLLYSFMNAQQKASAIEKFIYKKLGGEKVKSSEDRGDAKINGDHYEMKTSTTNQGAKLNIRQIRLYQDVEYYLCSYISERDLENSKTYRLTKAEMEEEVSLVGGFTHGTKKANENKTNPEYSITIDVYNENNEHTKRWNEKYWYNDLYNALTKQENE